MRVVKYVKYNRTKAPLFQVKTEIVQDGTEEYVEKSALCSEAHTHIRSFCDKYELLKSAYLYVKPVKAEIIQDRIRFEYVKASSISSILDEYLNDTDRLLGKIHFYVDKIFSYRPECNVDWVQTEEFSKVFGEVSFENPVPAVCPANIDAIFDNFLEDGQELYCIDYEWTFSFPVPQEYILYRALFYYYNNNRIYLEKKISGEDFLAEFGISKEKSESFWQMEDHFQQYAHGKDRKYIYTNNYVKQNANFAPVLRQPYEAVRYIAENEQRTQDIIRLNEQLHESLDDAVAAHQKLHTTTEELLQTHERLHQTTEELVERDKSLQQARSEIREKDQHIENYQATIAKYHKMARNPFFAAAQLSKAVGRKCVNLLPPTVHRGLSVLKNEGMDVFVYKVKRRKKNKNEYEQWMEQNEKNLMETETLQWNPLISVVVPVYNVADSMLRACIDSVRNQSYENWELCLVDDHSTMESVRKVLAEYEGMDRIKIKYRSENGHISRTTNDGIALAAGEFIGLMDCDDLLAPNALYEMAKLLNANPAYDFIYSDEDKINEEGTQRRDPFFKPDWSPDTFMSYMYTCHFSVFRKALIVELGGLRVGYEGSQDYDLVLRLMEKTRNIGHVPKILYHWRMRKESTANDLTAKPYIVESTIKAKTDALQRRGLTGKLSCITEITQYRVTYEPQGNPLVSVIIPSKDNYPILKQCVSSIREQTTYANYEIVIVDNGSNDENMQKYKELADTYGCTYFHEKKEFNFSYMCNMGASLAKGELLLFLNDDIEIPQGQGEWLSIMAGQAQVSYSGAVGAKLVYPGTNLIQHVGVLNLSIGPGHAFHRFDDSLNFYWGRNILDYNFSIVTGACLMVQRKKFEEIGHFDETFPVAYNDVELCFKLIEHGYYNVLRNDVKLVHHESISRGYDENPEKAARLLRERQHLYDVHPDFKGYDPCYNPNLTPDKGDFSLNLSVSQMEPSKVQEIRLAGCTENEKNMHYSIDAVECSNGKIRISGWAFLEGHSKHNRIPAFILLQDETGKTWKVRTNKTYRPDVGAANGRYGKVSLTGFDCMLDKDQLAQAQGSVRIGIQIKKSYVMTDRTITVL